MCISVGISFHQEVTLCVIKLERPFWSKKGMDSSMERDHYKLKRSPSAYLGLVRIRELCEAAVPADAAEEVFLSLSLSAKQYNSEVA